MLKANYNCTQQELYTVCNQGWVSCNQNLSRFAILKAKYTMPFVTSRQEEVTNAQLLPDDQQRGEAAETLRIQLAEKAVICLNTWQKLKRYIADAYPANLQKSKTEAAGQDYYRGASGNNWEDVQGLMTSGLTFITDNEVELTNLDNMPATFSDEFATIRTDFNTFHQNFLDAESAAVIATEEKQFANNTIYTAVINMFLDGQEIYKNEEAMQKLFIFEQVLALVSGPGVAGIKGTVTDNTPAHNPVPAANIFIVGTSAVGTTDPEGKYQISPVVAGTYPINVIAPGYQPLTIPAQQILVGTISTLNITLIPTAP